MPNILGMKKPRTYKHADAALTEAFNRSGGLCALAEKLERTPASLSGWRRVPPEHVLTIERISGVPRHVQRPDLYPPPEEVA
ncbi:transcriptional regulator [Paramagnetospirillum magneticum]|uniref:transcriptional regulator n=1 Tax=Paramagnetospirillum magneticum TaxID=84159 RepID=UPI0018D466C4|nr:YdaS family helix-turn-helix protein [Paramagnetospirillum magneticum]